MPTMLSIPAGATGEPEGPGPTPVFLERIGPGRRVLAVGRVDGGLLRGLSERGCRTTAVVPAPWSVPDGEEGRGELVVAGDPDTVDWEHGLGGGPFDVIAVVDGLGAFRDPAAFLARARGLLAPGGCLLVSAPNVAHAAIRIGLLTGQVRASSGADPVGFFGREELESVVSRAGLVVGHLERQEEAIEAWPPAVAASSLPTEVVEALVRAPEARTRRFIATVHVPVEAGELARRLASLEARWSTLAGGVDSLQRDLAAVSRRIDALEQRVAPLEGIEVQVGALRDELDAISARGGLFHALVGGHGSYSELRQGLQEVERSLGVEATKARGHGPGGASRNGRSHPVVGGPVTTDAYGRLVRKVREIVRSAIPPGAAVLVVSKGDDALLELGGCEGWHFPQTERGIYAGHHPADSREAIDHLEALRRKGAEYLLFPQTAFWWLTHYGELQRHLEASHRLLVRLDDTCVIYRLCDR